MATTIGSFIKKYRKKEKLSGIELSKEIGVSSAYISQIETGRITLPSQKIMIQLARHLNIPMQKMMEITGYSFEESVIEEETAKQKEIKAERARRKAKEKREYTKKLKEDRKIAEEKRKEKVAEEKERLEQKRQLKKEEQNQERDEKVNQQGIETSGAELEVNGKEEVVNPVDSSTPNKSLISMHPLEVLLSLETTTLADLFMSHMRKGKIVYHTYLVHALVKGADGNGSSREIIDLMIANHHELLHLDVFQMAIVRYAEQTKSNTDDPIITAINSLEDVETQSFFPLWKKAYFSDSVLKDYGDYVLSSHKVDTFELQQLLQSHMVLLNGRIVNPNVVKTIRALLFEAGNM